MVATPILPERRLGHLPDAPEPPDRQRREEGRDAARRDLDEPVRLAEVGRDLRGQLHLGDAGGDREAALRPHRRA